MRVDQHLPVDDLDHPFRGEVSDDADGRFGGQSRHLCDVPSAERDLYGAFRFFLDRKFQQDVSDTLFRRRGRKRLDR